MRKILTVAALVLALGCPTFAGEIHTPAARSSGIIHTPTVTPPPPANAVQEPTADNETLLAVDGTAAEVILNLFLGVLPLF